MKNKLNRVMRTMTAIMLAAVVLAGCGNSGTGAQSPDSGTNPGQSVSTAEGSNAGGSGTESGAGGNGADNGKAGSSGTGGSAGSSEAGGSSANGSGEGSSNQNRKQVELIILAAASLTDVCNEIKTMYEADHAGVILTFSYGGSGALQTQIEEGAPADLFISAAAKQMTALDEEGLMDADSIFNLLENKVVLIVPGDSDSGVASFDDAATDKVAMIGLGEPGSVPVGQYSEEIFTTLGILDKVKEKANYGSDVRTVLSWVETGAVDCGVVYATDAYTSSQVKIICEAPEGSCKQVIYPAGIVKASGNAEEAAAFLEYLRSDEIMALFESYGFSRAQ